MLKRVSYYYISISIGACRPVEVIQCRQAYVLDDLSNGEY
jgi:hypothetical protein